MTFPIGLSLRWAHMGFIFCLIDAFMFHFNEPRLEKTAQLVRYIVQLFLSFLNQYGKAVVGGPAGPASAGPLFWQNMLSAVSLFLQFQSLLSCLPVI